MNTPAVYRVRGPGMFHLWDFPSNKPCKLIDIIEPGQLVVVMASIRPGFYVVMSRNAIGETFINYGKWTLVFDKV